MPSAIPPRYQSTVQPSPDAIARRQSGRARHSVRAAAPYAPSQSPANPEMLRIIRRQAVGNWMLPSLASITPRYIESILRGALGGNHVQQWELFDLMEDTWPRLLKNLAELKGAVAAMDWKLDAWAEEEKPPTDSALERKRVISEAVWRMNPAPDSDDNGFEQTIADILDAWAKGISVLELVWEQRRAGNLGDLTLPQCTYWVHPRNYAWSEQGFLGLNPQQEAGVFGQRQSTVVPFPENKFLIAICKAKSGSPNMTALLRPLAWWWCAANFSADWLMNLAQLFGIPFRWATYSQEASDATVAQIGDLLANMGSSGYGAFPDGTNLNFLEGGKNAGQSPQADLTERADKNCDLLILGQTLTSDTGNSGAGGGSLALGKVHKGVRDQIIQSAANFVARVLNQQLVPAVLKENYGDAEEAPYFCPAPSQEEDAKAMTDAYGIAVRAGAITPNQEDEAHFRQRLGLPPMSKAVLAEWKKQGGARAPITIQQEGMPAATTLPPGGAAPGGAVRKEVKEEEKEKPEKLQAADAMVKAFADSIAEKRDPMVRILNRFIEIKDDAQFLAAMNQLYREMDNLTALLTADATRQANAIEQITGRALAKGLTP